MSAAQMIAITTGLRPLMPPAYIGQRHYKLSSSRYINANSLFTHYLVCGGRGKGLGC